jgi:hypothetical protein
VGFYVRKSVSVGPFRFNFSNSGIGVSAGIKGLRVGTSPRGNYITVGRGGLYYRATLPSLSSPTNPSVRPPLSHPIPSPPTGLGTGPMVAINSAPVSSMQDSSSIDLINEINAKARRPTYWKWTACAGVIALWLTFQAESHLLTAFTFVALAFFTAYIALRDMVAKTTVLCYQLDVSNENAFTGLHSAFKELSSCRKAWRIDAQAAVHNRKYHAGANTVVKRKSIYFGKGLPPNVKSNLDVPFVKAGPLSLYFMPDRVLAFSSNNIGAISYKDLSFQGFSQRFIEDDAVPSDTTVVDRTWKYVNKKGGPDKRFKDNRELPIALYEEIKFQSASGLNETYQLSKHSLSKLVGNALDSVKQALPT